ncbi:EamA family transporter [Candidatus Gracilibacteria bacterium]|nr:EamA family transporter [Candidatus Gracilibacteria bacterium]
MLSINPLFTLIFAYFILHEVPTWWQAFGFIPIVIGILLILKPVKNT